MRYDLTTAQVSVLLPAVIHAEDRLARLDERVLRHAIGDGFRERGHFFDAVAALWIGGVCKEGKQGKEDESAHA